MPPELEPPRIRGIKSFTMNTKEPAPKHPAKAPGTTSGRKARKTSAALALAAALLYPCVGGAQDGPSDYLKSMDQPNPEVDAQKDKPGAMLELQKALDKASTPQAAAQAYIAQSRKDPSTTVESLAQTTRRLVAMGGEMIVPSLLASTCRNFPQMAPDATHAALSNIGSGPTAARTSTEALKRVFAATPGNSDRDAILQAAQRAGKSNPAVLGAANTVAISLGMEVQQ